MKDKLSKRIQELSAEATKLVQERERLGGIIGEIEVRLHQISGSILELDQILQSLNKAASEPDRKDPEA